MRLRNLRPAKIDIERLRFSTSRRNRTQRDGATSVEFALVAPIFFLMVFICLEFIRLNMIRNLTQDAAYFAARRCMVPGATTEEALDEANSVLGMMYTKGAVVDINGGAPIDRETREIVVVVTVPMAENSFVIPHFTGEIEFSSTARMRAERYDGFYDPILDGLN